MHYGQVLVAGVAVFFVIALGVNYASQIHYGLGTATQTLFRPLFHFSGSLKRGWSAFFSLGYSKISLNRENEELRDALYRSNAALLDRNLLFQENEELKEVLGRKNNRNLTLAAVLSRPPRSPYDTFLIDLGSEDGVSVGMRVFALGNVSLGQVAVTYGKTSLVRLYSSPGEEYDAYIGDGGVVGIATGRGGGNFEMILPRGVDISEGDPITMPDIERNVFAIAEKVGVGPSETFQKVLFKNPVNLAELRWVELEY